MRMTENLCQIILHKTSEGTFVYSVMESVSDEFLAQLMDMGFEREHILACQMSLTASGTPITIQSVAEWYVNIRNV